MDKTSTPSLSTLFKICYYLSSLLIQYIILMIIFITGSLEKSNFYISNKISERKIVFCIILLLMILCISSLIYVKLKLNEIQKNTHTFGTYKVQLSYKKNKGFREFFLSMLIPIISTFSILDLPGSSFLMIVIIQLIIFFFYENSTDVFPNLSLILMNYNIYEMKERKNYDIEYIIGRKGINYEGKEVTIMPLIPKDKNSKFAVIREKTK